MPHVHGPEFYCKESICSSATHLLSILVLLLSVFLTVPGVVVAEESPAAKVDMTRKAVSKEVSLDALSERVNSIETRLSDLNEGNNGSHTGVDNSIRELKVQIEESSIQLYDSRAKDMEHFKQLEEAVAHINDYLGKFPQLKPHPIASVAVEAAAGNATHPAGESGEYSMDEGTADAQQKWSLPAANNSSYAAPLEAMLATVLVFLAPLGFSFLEASRSEQSAVPRIFLRNLLVTAIMLLTFATAGSWISYGQSLLVSIGATGDELAPNGEPNDTFWLFHLELTIMVGLIANTILSDRISLWGHGLMALLLGLVVHPLLGRWVWMGHWLPASPGWLEGMGFRDFAGATAIHSAAAWFSLAWLWRFPLVRSEQPGQSIGNPVQAMVALFVLWLNWFGLAMGYQHIDVQLMALPIINVSLAGAMAIVVAFFLSMNRGNATDADGSLLYLRMATGVLGGLVAISAGVDRFTPVEAMLVGGVAGVIHAYAYRILSATALKKDHTAAALIATHGVCGVWGTLSLGFMGSAGSFSLPELSQLGIQALGIVLVMLVATAAGVLGALPFHMLTASGAGRLAGDAGQAGGSLAEAVTAPASAPVEEDTHAAAAAPEWNEPGVSEEPAAEDTAAPEPQDAETHPRPPA